MTTNFEIPDGPFDPAEWNILKKSPENINPFDGVSIHYRTWATRIRLHMMSKQTGWLRILELTESEQKPLTKERIASFKEVDSKPVNVAWLSQHLWALICNNVTNAVQVHAVALAGGEEFNGLELWRRLVISHEGGAEQVTIAGVRNFHNSPNVLSQSSSFGTLGNGRRR